MSFDGSEGEEISLSAAADLTEAYRNNHSGEIKAIFIGKDHIDNILGQTGCKGIRVYFGNTADDDMTVVMVGAKGNEDDQITSSDKIINSGEPCPSRCGEANDLNGNTT